MRAIDVLSLVLVVLIGFAVHRASLCNVRAVAELIDTGSAGMLRSFAKAVARQKQLHRLRHIIRELHRRIPASEQNDFTRELAGWGCGTTMHVVRLDAPPLAGEDHTKDIDFSEAGIRARWQARALHRFAVRVTGSRPTA